MNTQGQRDWLARSSAGVDQICGYCKTFFTSKRTTKKVTCGCGAVSLKGNLLYTNRVRSK